MGSDPTRRHTGFGSEIDVRGQQQRPAADQRIARVPLPREDPISGARGPLVAFNVWLASPDLAVARHFWTRVVRHHTFATGGHGKDEYFREPDRLGAIVDGRTAETCNIYNMLKLTRELWLLNPDNASYFDFYERALLNHLLGQQNTADPHGHICYFTGLNPGHRRGNTGPAWGGGNWSTDYTTFWCCQGTGLETNTKLADSVYFRSGTTLGLGLDPAKAELTKAFLKHFSSEETQASLEEIGSPTAADEPVVPGSAEEPRPSPRRSPRRRRTLPRGTARSRRCRRPGPRRGPR